MFDDDAVDDVMDAPYPPVPAVDPWAPAERDWKEFAEPALAAEDDSRKFDRAIFETDCPKCGKHVGAMIVDGPDPVFVELVCPLCNHGEAVTWTERVR